MLWNVDDIILYFVPHNFLIPFGRPSNRVTRPCPICILGFPSGFAWWKNNISTKTFFVYTIERNIYCLFSLEQHFTSISPSRTFTDGENIELQCAENPNIQIGHGLVTRLLGLPKGIRKLCGTKYNMISSTFHNIVSMQHIIVASML
jgi:hypothetical protein